MASDTDASLVGLIEVLNSAILVSILELSKHPALHDSHKLRLRQESQRLRIWGNELGIAQGGLEVRLRGEQELEYSLALAHIMVGNGLVTVEQCLRRPGKRFAVERAADRDQEPTRTPLQLAIATLEKQYPQFSDNFSETRFLAVAIPMSTDWSGSITDSALDPQTASRTQSVAKSDGTPTTVSDITDDDKLSLLNETLADVSASIDRLLRLAPFLEQYLEGGFDDAVQMSSSETPEQDIQDDQLYIDRILTRFPQASHEHVRIIVEARRLFRAQNLNSWNWTDTGTFRSDLHSIEQDITEDQAIPYPSMPKTAELRPIKCEICNNLFKHDDRIGWRLHVHRHYWPFACMERTCPHSTKIFGVLLDYYEHSQSPHDKKSQWSCRLCGFTRFAAKSQLQYHAETVHYIPAEAAMGLCELWEDKVSAQQDETECLFCNEAYGTEKFARIAHLGGHMVEIALLMPLSMEWQTSKDKATTAAPTQRSYDVCILCRKRKLRCDKARPSCGTCKRLGHECAYEEVHMKPRPKSGDLKPLTGERSNDQWHDSDEVSNIIEFPHHKKRTSGLSLDRSNSEYHDFTVVDVTTDEQDNLKAVRPLSVEDAKEPARAPAIEDPKGIAERMKELRANSDSSDDEEQERRYRRKKKKWSAGSFKRSHSQSVQGDSSYSDNDPVDDIDATARRLRRRVRRPGDQPELVFEDGGSSNANNILEMEEPEEGRPSSGPLSRPDSLPAGTSSVTQPVHSYVGEIRSDKHSTMESVWYCPRCKDGPIPDWNPICNNCDSRVA